jgi:hypothetical protein
LKWPPNVLIILILNFASVAHLTTL